MITEDYANFEISKLLKEKGFKSDAIHYYYDKDGDLLFSLGRVDIGKNEFLAPTMQIVMKWLRNVHGLFIHISVIREASCWLADIQDIKGDVKVYPVKKEFPNYEKACEGATKYCLENLI